MRTAALLVLSLALLVIGPARLLEDRELAGVRFDVMLVDAEGRVRRIADAFRDGD